ncbi:SAM-dependent methyltransferase [Staphylococcus auricularis]|uniref:MazG nucleotide pyrophosphohydrolase domain-containing protein n=1 Tax=Staphylococcus auricularis TaxID=29379 RepID=UPI001EF2E3A3|nr:MazG nucleotide pyrophosphohydrolase domain-containing protein [Staphylococcus auricularis]MCG7342294.1 SAM-dependent methyltransferase [Staphylococcus auricularis]
MSHKITVIGLGNYGLDDLPLGIYRFIENQSIIYARTLDHPVIESLSNDVTFKSFDAIYEQYDDFSEVYDAIVAELIELAATEDVVYAVPGHPRVAETTTVRLAEKAAQDHSFELEVKGGKSFIDDVFTSVGRDPNDGFTLLDATDISAELLNVRTDTLITQVYSAMVAADLKLTLMERYPDEHVVYIVKGAHSGGSELKAMPLHEIDFDEAWYDNLTSVLVPRVTEPQSLYGDFEFATQVIDHLVDDEKGCPWDKEQTHDSLKRYLIEESFELFEAIDNEDDWHMVEELGDILLQVLLHTSIGKKEGYFDITEVIRSLTSKMIRRHPHVFGDAEAQDTEDLKEIWADAKAKEGKVPRVKFEKVFADHFMKLYDETKQQSLDEAELRRYSSQGGEKQ